MRLISSSLLLLTILTVAPLSVAAQTTDFYADALTSEASQAYESENAVGQPDGIYMTFLGKDGTITLDMGEDEEGTDDLTLHLYLLNYGASYRVEFMDGAMNILETTGNLIPIAQSEVVVDYTMTSPYRYVRITSTETEIWKLDAIEAAAVVDVEMPEEEPAEEPSDEQPEDTASAQGLLVKLVDDGDALTTTDAAVYLIGGDGMRHAFSSESVFFSWFADYETLAYIDPANLASYQLGDNVTVRPGTHLIKLATDPKVYAVEPGGVLRWVTTEEIAVQLYGASWADRVIDVSDAFFGNYEVGDPISEPIHPNGTIGYLPSGEVVYVSDRIYYSLPGSTYDHMRFRGEYLVPISETIADSYSFGGDLNTDDSIQYPF